MHMMSADQTALATATSEFKPKPKFELDNNTTCEPTNREEDLQMQVIFNSNSENQINVKVDNQGEGVLEPEKIHKEKKKRRLR